MFCDLFRNFESESNGLFGLAEIKSTFIKHESLHDGFEENYDSRYKLLPEPSL